MALNSVGKGEFLADFLVVTVGSDLDPAAAPGLSEGGHNLYVVTGAESLRDARLKLRSSRVVVLVKRRSANGRTKVK
jgi:sulfide:quinone oxidoreductase